MYWINNELKRGKKIARESIEIYKYPNTILKYVLGIYIYISSVYIYYYYRIQVYSTQTLYAQISNDQSQYEYVVYNEQIDYFNPLQISVAERLNECL